MNTFRRTYGWIGVFGAITAIVLAWGISPTPVVGQSPKFHTIFYKRLFNMTPSAAWSPDSRYLAFHGLRASPSYAYRIYRRSTHSPIYRRATSSRIYRRSTHSPIYRRSTHSRIYRRSLPLHAYTAEPPALASTDEVPTHAIATDAQPTETQYSPHGASIRPFQIAATSA